jgi:lipoprotein-anchoring transpeptidase ErfK/SrfK
MPESLHTIFKKMELKFMARRIDVSTSQHQLKLFEGNRLIKSYPIAVGKILSPSPSGTYTIINKQHNPGGPFGVLWMGLSKPHYGIHGTNNPASIGRNVSHGCIRMFNLDVIDLSNRVSIGTRVFIHK